MTHGLIQSVRNVLAVENLYGTSRGCFAGSGFRLQGTGYKEIAPGTLRLRAERRGDGDGRVYLIVVKAVDTAGNLGLCVKTVTVPKSRGGADVAAVERQAAEARAYCLTHAGAPPPGYFRSGDGPVIGPKQ